jgi:hypothetical protein
LNRTPGLNLPYITPGQVQKDLRYNDALQSIDVLLTPAVETVPMNEPPANAAAGQCYIVGPEPSGVWQGKSNTLASYAESGWRFVNCPSGTSVFIRSEGVFATFAGGIWELGAIRGSQLLIDGQKVVGARGAAIADPTGGSTIDAEARGALDQILAALRGHGLIGM